MAFPTVNAQAATTDTTTGVFTMPAFTAGQLLLANVGCLTSATGASSVNGAWTLVGSTNVGSTTFVKVWAKVAQASDTCTVAGGGRSGGFITSIDNWSGSIAGIGYAGTTGAINPPALNMTTARDYLWFAGGSNFTNSITAAPTNYTNLANASFNAGDHLLALARRTLNASSEDPGAFTGTANTAGGWTVAIPPLGVGSFLPFFM